MSYASIIRDHLDWIATVEGDDAPITNAVRESDNLSFVLTINEDVQGAEEGEAGTYAQVGRAISGSVKPAEITPAVADIILFGGTRWRIMDVDPQRERGGVIACYDIRMGQLE